MNSGRSKFQPVGIYLNSLRRKACSTVQAGTWKRRPVFISQERVKVFAGASFTQTSGAPCFIKMNLKPKKHTWQNAYLAWKEPNDDRWGEGSPGTRDCFEAIYRNMIDPSKLNRLLWRYTHTMAPTWGKPQRTYYYLANLKISWWDNGQWKLRHSMTSSD